MQELIDQLNEPDKHFPVNFDTPKRANALLMCLCQEAAESIKSQAAEIETLEAALEAKITICRDSEIAKYKALCDQMAYAMEMHGAPFLHHELRYNEALEAWRAIK